MRALDLPNYKLTGNIEDPIYIDFTIYGLHVKKYYSYGELILTEYYKTLVGNTYSDLVLKEEDTYTRNEINLAISKVKVITWYKEDDSVGCTNTIHRVYDTQESITESEIRRSNLVSDAQIYTLSQVGIVNCQDLLNSLNNEINLYVKGSTQPLFDSIQASTKEYLTQEMKDNLITILTIL